MCKSFWGCYTAAEWFWNQGWFFIQNRMILKPKPMILQPRMILKPKKMILKPRMIPKPRTPGNQKWHGSAMKRCAFFFFRSIVLAVSSRYIPDLANSLFNMNSQKKGARCIFNKEKLEHIAPDIKNLLTTCRNKATFLIGRHSKADWKTFWSNVELIQQGCPSSLRRYFCQSE